MKWNSAFFQKRPFTKQQIQQFFDNAERDLSIAMTNSSVEVIFTFTYNAFLKLGITLISSNDYKVKSRQGHHVQIIYQFSRLLKDEKIEIYGEAMRRKRNIDLYAGGCLVTQKEVKEYLNFVKKLLKKVKQFI